MGEAVPLSLFQTVDGGLRLFLDSDCKQEEEVDETNTIQKVYKINVPNIIRGKKKFTTRYIKNTGFDQLLYAVFPVDEVGVKATFVLNNTTEEKEIANGILIPQGVHKLDIYVDVPKVGENPELYLGFATRPML